MIFNTLGSLLAEKKPIAVTSASIMADMIENVTGNLVEVKAIVPIGGDPHIYDPTPADAKLIYGADIIFVNGLTFEGWINELIQSSGSSAPVITMTDGIKPLSSSTYANASDPHCWMDVTMAKQYVRNVNVACKKQFPQYSEEFDFNTKVYLDQLEELDAYVLSSIEKIPQEKRILITSHDAFQYYGKRYGLQLESILGTSTDADAQTSDIIRLAKVIRTSKVPAVFVESTINPKLLTQIAEDNNVVVGGSLYSDSIGDKDSPAPSYIDMIRHNTNTIVKGLSRTIAQSDSPSNEKQGISIYYWLLPLLVILVFVILYFTVFNKKS